MCVIALACTCTCHIKNTCAVCHVPKTLYVVLSKMFPIHSSTPSITLFLISLVELLYSSFYLLFFIDKFAFSF